MQDYRIETFLAVCQEMNYTRAANMLHITQPAVSQHIRYLEEFYGCRLFEMHGKTVSLTQAGKLLLEASRTQYHDEAQLKKRMKMPTQSPLIIGATLSVAEGMLQERFASFLIKHAQSNVSMRIANTDTLLADIDQGKIDVAFVEGNFNKESYDYVTCGSETYVAVCAADEPELDNLRNLDILFEKTLLLREKGSGSREILERWLANRNAGIQDFKRCIEIGSIHMIKELLLQQVGITFLYEHIVKEELQQKRLVKLALPDMPLHHDITFLWRRHSQYGEEYRQLLKQLL